VNGATSGTQGLATTAPAHFSHAVIAAYVADAVAAARAGVTLAGAPAKAVRVAIREDGRSINLDVKVILEYGVAAPVAARAVDAAIRHDLDQLVAVTIGTIRVVVEDVA
jgi:uncharacterized alkaline shock family protein YloU